MTLLNLKPSTIDIDFTMPKSDRVEFERALANVPHGFKIDSWSDGMVFTQILPNDYLKKSIEIVNFQHTALKALHPIDSCHENRKTRPKRPAGHRDLY